MRLLLDTTELREAVTDYIEKRGLTVKAIKFGATGYEPDLDNDLNVTVTFEVAKKDV